MILSPLSPYIGVGLAAIGILWVLGNGHRILNRKIPGPVIARVTKLWYLLQMRKGNFHATNIDLPRKYGPVVQIAPGYFSLDDPESMKLVYRHANPLDKGEWYSSWTFGPKVRLENLFSIRPASAHSQMRRKVAAMYTMSALVSYEPFVDGCIRAFRDQLDQMAASNAEINLTFWCQCYAFDDTHSVKQLTCKQYGERFGFLDEGKDVDGMIMVLEIINTVCTYLGLYLWVQTFFDFLSKLISRKPSKLDHLNEDQLQRTRSEGALKHPRSLEKVRQELDSSILASSDAIKLADVQKLPYFQAAIKEALRMHPATGLPLWRTVPRGGMTIGGRYFAEGTNLGVNSWVAHQNQDVYGPDADQYRPERRLETKLKEKQEAMEQSFTSFGKGSRTCIGKNISLLEINKLVPIILRDYDLEFAVRREPTQPGMQLPGRNRWFVKPEDLPVRVRKRNASAMSCKLKA
ncbi:cytochrome P450 [Aspergillus homomorphus CBS 101889]|uniref:Cytochrome P450 n=1 Tax=Aspergillus homomorphus (strain CBS 101889) TaxID=1450537 RepID=A0A395HRK3_ASPHC|nr:cytochrome P450 [Aspergillus homomorphus CBS 101889]RAL09965.1 cytochrome P450 [Aspergillus homomorphus CBS 101889]